MANPIPKGIGKVRRLGGIVPWKSRLEILRQLPEVTQYLKPGQTMAALQIEEQAMSDTEAARKMQRDKQLLFTKVQYRRTA